MKSRTILLYSFIILCGSFGIVSFIRPPIVQATCLADNLFKGNQTISANCTIDANTIEGLDQAGGTETQTTNNAVLTINNNATVTITAGTTQTTTLIPGTIVLTGGGKITMASTNTRIITNSPTWVGDRDADGWMASTSAFAATASARRRRGLMRASTQDCNDSAHNVANNCYGYGQGYYQGYYYGYGQGYYYGYGQGYYYGYGQGYYYGYGQTWYYGYGQSGYCFLEGTDVLLADGTTKNIEDIRPGDAVLSYDLNTRAPVTDIVQKQLVYPSKDGGYYLINDSLRVTGKHYIWSPSRLEWVFAEDLQVGNTLLDPQGNSVPVRSITFVNGTNTTYNLQLSGINGDQHNFFADGILVHNLIVKY